MASLFRMTPIFTSPFSYVGGKRWAVADLLNLIPEGTRRIVAPFMGGGAFELNCAIRGYTVNGFDIDASLVNFWRCWLTDAVKVDADAKAFVKAYSREGLRAIRKSRVMTVDSLAFPDLSDFENASRYYAFVNLGFACRWTGNYIKDFYVKDGILMYDKTAKRNRVLNDRSPCHFLFATDNGGTRGDVHNRLQLRDYQKLPLSIDRSDFREVIDVDSATFLYCDPPYYGSWVLYTSGEEFAHADLCELLKRQERWVLSYNDCPEIREMYRSFRMLELTRAMGLRSNTGYRGELLILSDVIRLPDTQMEFNLSNL